MSLCEIQTTGECWSMTTNCRYEATNCWEVGCGKGCVEQECNYEQVCPQQCIFETVCGDDASGDDASYSYSYDDNGDDDGDCTSEFKDVY